MDFKSKFDKWIVLVNEALETFMESKDGPGAEIVSAMKYSLMAGGKRLRPVLALGVCELLGGNKNEVLPYACAIEMIHTYSLIHDDLPAMDNDDYRRGVPTNHKVFGDAMAILAGDALLNKAYEIMLSSTLSDQTKLNEKLKAMNIIATGAGAEGMIRGQVIDLAYEGTTITKETLKYMHRCKTGSLITAPVLASAFICGATDDELEKLKYYGDHIGLAFQIKDDIMDVESSLEQMGKAAGSDAAAEKSTYVTLYGVSEAENLLEKTVTAAVDALAGFGDKASFLKELAIFIKQRNH